MIRLRKLLVKDAPYMYEWMHYKDIYKSFRTDMGKLTLDDAKKFCEEAGCCEDISTGDSRHYAIVDSKDDIYLGTISLKNISIENRNAEYAIVTRKEAWGKGIAYKATGLILDKAFSEMGLHRVYLSVYSNNVAAIRLYERCGFKYEGEFREHFVIDGEYVNWKWYGILREEFDKALFCD